jgi:transcriptional regulator with XRE-family HTH domain
VNSLLKEPYTEAACPLRINKAPEGLQLHLSFRRFGTRAYGAFPRITPRQTAHCKRFQTAFTAKIRPDSSPSPSELCFFTGKRPLIMLNSILSIYNTANVNKVKSLLCCFSYDETMGFRENLKSELAYKGMLVKELAALTGISRHTLDNYLNVRGHIPSADIAVKIARALHVSVEYLVTGNDPHREDLPQSRGNQDLLNMLKNIKSLDEQDRRLIYAIVQLFCNQRKKR